MTNKKLREEVVSPTGGAITGGVAGALIGAAAAGPLGVIPAATVGAITGLMAGKKAQEELRPQILYAEGDLEHFEKHHVAMPYHIPDMTWVDYEPAYRFAFNQYQLVDANVLFDNVSDELMVRWQDERGLSRLTWEEAKPVARHIWEAYDTGIDPFVDYRDENLPSLSEPGLTE